MSEKIVEDVEEKDPDNIFALYSPLTPEEENALITAAKGEGWGVEEKLGPDGARESLRITDEEGNLTYFVDYSAMDVLKKRRLQELD